MIIKGRAVSSEKADITFQLPATIWAETVHLVGDFNDWNRRSHPLKRAEDGHWELTMHLPKGQVFQFRYLIDGTHWQNDWNADRYVPNPFGGDNSVLET